MSVSSCHFGRSDAPDRGQRQAPRAGSAAELRRSGPGAMAKRIGWRVAMTPLEGLKVVELARILAGPWAGQALADLGAEVIKVEAPQGDDTRQWGPPFVDHDGEKSAAYFHCCNRGKKSVVIDFRTPE